MVNTINKTIFSFFFFYTKKYKASLEGGPGGINPLTLELELILLTTVH